MIKKELRSELLAARQKLTKRAVEEQSRALFRQFQDHVLVPQDACVHLFRSLAKFKEVNTELFFSWFFEQRTDLRIVLPRVVSGQKELDHHLYLEGDVLQKSRWGIEEPLSSSPVIDVATLDLVVVPLLAFDQRGFRIGYGGGFYDRFLAETRPDCQKIGVAFEGDYQSELLPVDEFDVSLDAVVTPSHTYRF